MISIENRQDGSLEAIVRTTDRNAALRSNKSTIELSLWEERSGVVRARLHEQEHGALCYLQGNSALLEVGDALGLEIIRCRSGT